MTVKQPDPNETLRQRAEAMFSGAEPHLPARLSPEETQRLLHELQVHQIELELQNEELRRTQVELEAARARYFDLYDLAPVGYVTLSEKGLILEANLTAAGLLGVERSALVRQPLTHFIIPEDQDLYYQLRKGLLETDAPRVCELRMVRQDGSPFWVRLEATAAQAAGGVPVCHAILSDITERVRSEQARQQAALLIQAQQEQLVAQNEELTAQNEELTLQGRALANAEANLQQTNAELEQRIEARSAELSAANAALQLANAALLRAGRLKDEFLANMSHELRTPLAGILGLAEVMDKGIYGDLTEKQRQALRMMQTSGEHLLQLINDILDLSKIEAGKVELQIVAVSVENVCQASLEFVKQAAHEKNLGLIFQPEAQVRQVQADERHLKQMLVNLLSNAVKFTPEGGQVGLEIAGAPTRQQVRFTVWDTGIGIAPEQQSLLFQPFVQLDGSLARKYEGTGLGLALVHSIAELHGGSVTVESAGLGQGSRFTITFPWTPSDEVKSAEHLPSSPTSAGAAQATSSLVSLAARLGRPPVILAVDDNPTLLMILTGYLEALECQVITAQNGAEGLAQAQAARPDLILLDIHMPDMDGLTVVRRLRAAGSAVPVIALTALAMPEDRELCLAAGANDYLSKPMSLDELTHVIIRHLGLERTAA